MKNAILPEISRESLEVVLDLVSDGIWDWNANTGYVYRSPNWYIMLGYDIDAFENTVFTWEGVIHPDDFDRVMDHFDSYITHKSSSYQIEYRCRTKSNDYLWIEDRAKVVEWHKDGTVSRMIGAHRDISAKKELELEQEAKRTVLQEYADLKTQELIRANEQLALKVEQIELMAAKDALTSLSNRYDFESKLLVECARAVRFNEPLALVALDLDSFKPVNDLNGHAEGDLVLKKVANIITSNIREIDLSARWGGDEFMILLPNTSLKQAFVLANKIRLLIDGGEICQNVAVTASFGVVQLDENEDPLRLVIRADKRLYESKHRGRNCVSS